MKRIHKLLSLILTICIAMSMLTGFAPANAVADSTATGSEVFELPDIVDSVEAKENDYIGRVEAEEKDLYTFVFANGDGTNTMRIYSHPVKYVADDGSIRDISLDIEAKRGGGFVTADHEIVTTFESKLTDGITLEYNDVEIMLVPALGLGTMPTAELSTDGKVVTYEMNDITSFVYELTYAGFKEDIVVEEYTGQTEYEFTLYTNGLTLCQEYGSYYLADAEGNVEATIGDIIVFTADERNNTMGSMTYETVRANQEYVLTIHLDAEYLADEDTVYPIRIDPTIEINYDNNGAGAIEDVTINQNSTFSGTSGSLYVGRHPAGSLSRVLMRFPNLSLNGVISADQIISASVELRDLMCQGDEDITVECYMYDRMAPTWTESGTTTWTSVGSSYIGAFLDSNVISFGEGNVEGQRHRYAFDITVATRSWASGTNAPYKGLVFKANSTFENQTGDAIKTWYKTFSSYNRAEDYRPSLSIIYNLLPSGGDSFEDAETLTLNTTYFVNIASANEKKYFKFVPSTTGFYTFESSTTLSCDPKAWLYNASSDQITYNDDGGSNRNFRLTYHLMVGVTYYFSAGCFNTNIGNYEFNIVKTTTASHISATSLFVGSQSTVSIDLPYKAKLYKFTPSVTGEYLFVSSDATGDPRIWLYNSSLNQVGYNDDGAGSYNYKLAITLTAGQTYYIVINQYSNKVGNCSSNFLMDVNLGQVTATGLHGASAGEIYSFVPQTSGTYYIETEQPIVADVQDTVAYLLDSNYNLISSNDNKNSSGNKYSRITATLTAGQEYKVLVTSHPDSLSVNCYIAIYKSGSLYAPVSGYAGFVKQFEKIGNWTSTYNCLAYAIGVTDSWVWPWVYDCPTLSQLDTYMNSQGYVRVSQYQSNCIVAYGFSSSEITHFSKVVAGTVTAKCGAWELMEHNEYDAYFANGDYGSPQAFYVKSSSKTASVNMDVASVTQVRTPSISADSYLSELDTNIIQQVEDVLNQLSVNPNGFINSYDLVYNNIEAYKVVEDLGNELIPYILNYVIESNDNGLFEAFLIASVGEMLSYDYLPGCIESNNKYFCEYEEYSPKYYAYHILLDVMENPNK